MTAGRVWLGYDKRIALLPEHPYGELEFGALTRFVAEAGDMPESTPVRYVGALGTDGQPHNPPLIPGAVLEVSFGSHRPPDNPISPTTTIFGEPADEVIRDFLDAECAACGHPILSHSTRRAGCGHIGCDCSRRPLEFR